MMVGCQYLPKYMATQLTGSFKLGRIKFEGVVDKLLILLLGQFKPLRLDRKHCFIEKLEYRFICFGVLDFSLSSNRAVKQMPCHHAACDCDSPCGLSPGDASGYRLVSLVLQGSYHHL